MAEPLNPQQQIDKPASATPVAEPAMFVMPEEYRHGATGKKLSAGVAAPPARPAPVIAPPAPVAPAPAAARPVTRGMARSTKIVLVAGGILLIGLAVAGYLVLASLAPSDVPTEERPPVVVRPEPVEEVPVEEEPKPAEVPVEETPDPFPNASTPGTDSDSDGVTDLEERLIYNTSARLPDTDSDGFLDGNEVFHRYNPGGTAPGTLLESGLVRSLAGPVADVPWYRVLYPSVWSADVPGSEWGQTVTFEATTGEQMRVTVFERAPGTSFAAWVAGRAGSSASFDASVTKNGYAVMTSEDQLTVYVEGAASGAGAGYALKAEYDAGIKATVDYLQTFKMMVNSIEWL